MQVNITKCIDTPEGKRYCPVVIGPNGRIKPDSVMVDGRQEKHPEAPTTSTGRKTARAHAFQLVLMQPLLTTVAFASNESWMHSHRDSLFPIPSKTTLA
jgi:hypothetical protein